MVARRFLIASSVAALLAAGGCKHHCFKRCGPQPAAYPTRPVCPVPAGQPFFGAPANIPPTNERVPR